MAGKLFEYAILYHPKTKKDENGNDIKEKSKVLLDVARVLAGNEKEVGILASRQIPGEYIEELEQVEIVVRPF